MGAKLISLGWVMPNGHSKKRFWLAHHTEGQMKEVKVVIDVYDSGLTFDFLAETLKNVSSWQICTGWATVGLGYSGFFSWEGTGGSPHPAKILPIPPHPTLVPVFGPRLVPPPAEVRPQKCEKFKYIFVSNLTTFKLKSTLKSCISCLK